MTAQFSDFYDSLDPDPLKRGKQFERFVKWFLKADPEWATQVDQVWLWDEWPGRWGVDCGIDLVFRHKNGGHWAVQAKCYSPDHHITKHDVDKFLSESNRPLIRHRLLIATTDYIGGNAKQVCDAQEKPVVRFLLSDFERSLLDYPASFDELPQARRKPRPEPREHQIEARDAVVQGLQAEDRGQLIMACGTGKTYVMLWVKEQLGAQRTLVLVPSLGLLSQVLREWTFAAAAPFEVLCVCSDQTVGAKGHDEAIHSVADLAFPVTSDADEVKRFLGGAGNRVVFATYQSSLIIAAAQAAPATPAFDLAVADEAHRCAGKVGSDFAAILDNAQIRSSKRLFATATPRTYSSTVHKAAAERGVEMVGMDNAALFGEVLHALPFGQAIARNLLTDYRVVIIGVDDPTIAQWIANRELVTTGTGIETDSESLAARIGMLKAIKDYDLRRVISFHSRVKRAEDFAADMQQTMEWVSDEHRPGGTLHTDFVSGNMPASERKSKLDRLKALAAGERGVLSNARCLSEGVDVPALDGVAFIDPRSSRVDIIQAVGRAIRLSPDKKAGTIVLPVFIKPGEDAAGTIEASNFKPVWEVLNALKAHDDVLACELDQIRTKFGRRPGARISENFLRKISIDLPATVDANFGSALRTFLVEQVTESWNERYGQLIAYKEAKSDCNVPFQWEGNPQLFTWCSTQRYAYVNSRLLPDRIERLEQIGFVWRPIDAAWEEMFAALTTYKQNYGDCIVPKEWSQNQVLARWVVKQRMDYREGRLSSERSQRLDELGFAWDPFASVWDEFFAALSIYKQKHGDCDVPREWPGNSKLGKWCAHQRTAYQKGKLSADRIHQMERLGFAWNSLDSAWEEMFTALVAYKQTYGDCYVARKWKAHPQLGEWCQRQRKIYKENKLIPDRFKRLEEIGFVWDPLVAKWEEMFIALVNSKQTYGDFKVPKNWDKSPELGPWSTRQRKAYKNNKLTADRIKRLESVGFEWGSLDASWEKMFAVLSSYKLAHGDCNVPAEWEENPELGQWCYVQRRAFRKNKISVERIRRLEQLGFVWERIETVWEGMFAALTNYKQAYGNCNVPLLWEVNPKLGQWCSSQRRAYKESRLPPERVKRLEQLGFIWDPKAAAWGEMFTALTDYKEIYGNLNVPTTKLEFQKLGWWCGTQRSSYKNNKLSSDRIDLLMQLGFRF